MDCSRFRGCGKDKYLLNEAIDLISTCKRKKGVIPCFFFFSLEILPHVEISVIASFRLNLEKLRTDAGRFRTIKKTLN